MKTVTKFCLKMVQNYLPDAFILAILLTFVVFCGGMFLMNKSALQMIEYWGRAYSSMFVFGMQMVLVLLTGYVLALTPLAKKILNKVTGIPKTPQQALGLTALVSIASCYINWGFGLVIGAVLAKEVGKKVKGLHFPLLVSAAYGGEIIRGPSSSIPLVSATPGNFMEKLGLPLTPVGDTLYSSWNLVMTAIIVIMLCIVYFNMEPPANEIVEYSEKEQEKPEIRIAKKDMTFAERLENAYWLNALFGLFPLIYLGANFSKIGLDLNLNLVILIFLTFGLYLHSSPNGFLKAVAQGIGASRGIILQFPLYAGMSGMMTASGLVDMISMWFVEISTAHTFPLYTFL